MYYNIARYHEKLEKSLSLSEDEPIKDIYTWTKREIHWYLSERRFLFMANSKEDLEKWLYVLNWLKKSQKIF